MPDWSKAFFIEKKEIYKEEPVRVYKHLQQLETLATYERTADNQVKVTLGNSMLIYDLITDFVGVWLEQPTHFSPEYVFAQEFTKHYNVRKYFKAS